MLVLVACSEPEPSEVTSVCWSRNGRYLLSGHAKPDKDKADKADRAKSENRICLWDVQAGTQVGAGSSTGGRGRRASHSVLEGLPARAMCRLSDGLHTTHPCFQQGYRCPACAHTAHASWARK